MSRSRNRISTLLVLSLVAGLLAAAAPAQARVPKCFGKPATIVGNGRGNTIRGTNGVDVIHAGGGGDVVRGRGGIDYICGVGGNDDLFGDAGDDRIDLGAGADTGHGGQGNDLVRGRPRELDAASYENSNAPIVANLGSGIIRGEGTDTVDGISHLIGTFYDDDILGNQNGNIIFGLGGADTIDGLAGDDELGGFDGGEDPTDGDDTLLGNLGNDWLRAGTGNDDLDAGDDIDLVDGGSGNDTMDGGGQSFDAVDFRASTQAVTVNLASGTATGMGTDSVAGVTDVHGTAYNDNLAGSARVGEGFYPYSGDDSINGGGGDEDAIVYQTDESSITADLIQGRVTGIYTGTDLVSQVEWIYGSQYGDTLAGDDTPNRIYGNFGNDNIMGRGGNDVIFGGGDTDTIDGGIGNDICAEGESLASCESNVPPPSVQRRTAKLRPSAQVGTRNTLRY